MTAKLRDEFSHYRCWIFDCDGVLLNSNAVKTQAFHDVARTYGEEAADKLVAFHVEHGGVSRFVKFQHLFEGILDRAPEAGEIDAVLADFAGAVKNRLMTCPAAPRIEEVLNAVSQSGPVYIASGGMQDELREVFDTRGLSRHFTAIYGSPDTKDTIVARERERGAMPDPVLFVGDARYDFEVAERFGLDFVFATAWSDFSDWRTFFEDKDTKFISSIADLLRD